MRDTLHGDLRHGRHDGQDVNARNGDALRADTPQAPHAPAVLPLDRGQRFHASGYPASAPMGGASRFDGQEVDGYGGQDCAITYLDADGVVQSVTMTLSSTPARQRAMAKAACFTSGTVIRTEAGPVQVEALVAGDRVETKDNGFQTVAWTVQRRLCAADLDQNPHLRPIRIRAGALGPTLPAHDLVVSPEHRIVICGSDCARLFGTPEVLVPVKALLNDHTITLVPEDEQDGVVYAQFSCERREVVYAHGAELDCCDPAAADLSGLDPGMAEEFDMVFPQLGAQGETGVQVERPVLKLIDANILLHEAKGQDAP